MNAVSQRMRVKTAETFPVAEVWNSPENFLLNLPVVTIVFDTQAPLRLAEGEHRSSALTSLLEHALRQRVSLIGQPWATGQSHSFENYFTESLRELEPFHVKPRRLDPFREKHTDADLKQVLFLTHAAYDHAKQAHIRDLWSWIAWQSHTSGTESIAAVVRAKEDASAATTKPLEWLFEPTTTDSLAHFEKYSVRDWDGYGAEPIAKETIEAARLFLRMLPDSLGTPDIAPGSDGTIGLEWVFDQGPLKKLFVDIGPGEVWSAYWRRTSGKQRHVPHEKITSTTKNVLAKLFEDLGA